MGGKQGEAPKRKEQESTPSTGRGAASALDALIRRRVPPAEASLQQQQSPPKGEKL